jgi:tRNA threonylcarbamoyladenosine biosynthesis protein TsaB
MAHILCFDTSTKACSIALFDDAHLVAYTHSQDGGYVHAELLHVLIDQVLQEAKLAPNQLDAIALGIGPGSYTGLRIGVSAAKGLAHGLAIPIVALASLQVIAATAIALDSDAGARYRPLMDARRMEVYSAVYNNEAVELEACRPYILDGEAPHRFEDLDDGPIYFFGDGLEKCRSILSEHANARFIDGVFPDAKHMGKLAMDKLAVQDIVDTAYFEPFYLKEYVAKKGKPMV